MTPFEIYSLIICIIVYVLLAGVGIFMIATVFKLSLKLIKSGAEDKEILKEYEKQKGKKKSCVFDCISSVFLCTILVLIFAFSTYVSCASNTYLDNAPTFKIVNSSSMATKNEKNEYLFKNNLNNQFSTFDLILTYKIPKEEDIKLYDIVVYEIDGFLIIHRVVGIEEKNERHPNERWFLLQGDAVSQADRFPVKYSQMRAIYKDQRIPFIGSFVAFMQSPPGYMCIILVGLAIIFTPIFEKKIEKAKSLRLAILIPTTQTVVTNLEQEVSTFNGFKGRINDKTFDEKLQELPIVKERYVDISGLLNRVNGVRTIESKKSRTFKSGNTALVKFAVKGKTLNSYIALSPAEYENSKYIYTNVSDVKKYSNYPMRVKVTSDRQLRWVKELLIDKINKSNLTLLEEKKVVDNVSTFSHLKNKKTSKSFKQKLKLSPLAKERYNQIKNQLQNIPNIRVIESKKSVTFKVKSLSVVKFFIKGKTLNAHLNLNPTEYENSKYIFINVSNIKKYSNYPMRVKVTSNRQVKWVKELISQIISKGDK